MNKLKFNPDNAKYYSEEFIKGFECGVERQFNADMAEKTAEEVAPIIRGKCSITHGMYENRIWCNNCGFVKVITGEEENYNFCPKCGVITE